MSRALLLSLLLALACAPHPRSPAAAGETAGRHAAAQPERPGKRAAEAVGELLLALASVSDGILHDTQLGAYVTRVGRRVARAAGQSGQHLRFHLSDADEVAARALPGGNVLLSRGALVWLGSEAELAAVLAHEIAHHARGHVALDGPAIVARDDAEFVEREHLLDADQERQADALAVGYLARAGYDPGALAGALEALHRGDRFGCRQSGSTCDADHDPLDPHPPLDARLSRIALVAGARAGEKGTGRFLAQIDGIELGPSRHRPRVVRRHYVAPGAVSIRLPDAWKIEQSGALVSADGEHASVSLVRLTSRPLGQSLRQLIEAAPHQWRQVAGLRALVGELGHDPEPIAGALLAGDGEVFVLAVRGEPTSAQRELERLLASARPAAPPAPPARKLRIVSVRRGSTLRAIRARACPGASLDELGALNGRAADAHFRAGSLVKCVSGVSP